MSDKFYTLLSLYAYRDKVILGLGVLALLLVAPLLLPKRARNLAAWLNLLVIIITLVKSLTM